MSSKRPALGKGIGALLSSAGSDGGRKYFLCPIEELKPHARQPRKTFDSERLQELADSIREKGVIQPLVVRRQGESYQIIAGERRWRAAQKAGLREVPVVIQDVSEDWALELALIENIQREDLNPIEEADAYRNLIDTFQLTQEEVAKRVGKDRSTVANALRLLRLPEKLRQDLSTGDLSMGHARAILALDKEPSMLAARDQVVGRGLSVRQTEALVKQLKAGASTKSDTPKKGAADPELAHLAEQLQRNLGTQVRVRSQGKGGKIEIVFYSPQDLDRLMEILGVD